MTNIKMLPTVKEEFPEIFTKVKGTLKKNGVKRFNCSCGYSGNQANTRPIIELAFGVRSCIKCGMNIKESQSYSVWERMKRDEVEIEDFILSLVLEHNCITKDELVPLIEEKYGEGNTNSLGYLCYFGYLKVDKEKRDNLGIVEYRINPDKNLSKRYERIQ